MQDFALRGIDTHTDIDRSGKGKQNEANVLGDMVGASNYTVVGMLVVIGRGKRSATKGWGVAKAEERNQELED